MLPRRRPISLQSAPPHQPPAHTIATGRHVHRCQSQRSLRRPLFLSLVSRGLPSPLPPNRQLLHPACSRLLPAPARPATAAPWNPQVATILPADCESTAESVAAV